MSQEEIINEYLGIFAALISEVDEERTRAEEAFLDIIKEKCLEVLESCVFVLQNFEDGTGVFTLSQAKSSFYVLTKILKPTFNVSIESIKSFWDQNDRIQGPTKVACYNALSFRGEEEMYFWNQGIESLCLIFAIDGGRLQDIFNTISKQIKSNQQLAFKKLNLIKLVRDLFLSYKGIVYQNWVDPLIDSILTICNSGVLTEEEGVPVPLTQPILSLCIQAFDALFNNQVSKFWVPDFNNLLMEILVPTFQNVADENLFKAAMDLSFHSFKRLYPKAYMPAEELCQFAFAFLTNEYDTPVLLSLEFLSNVVTFEYQIKEKFKKREQYENARLSFGLGSTDKSKYPISEELVFYNYTENIASESVPLILSLLLRVDPENPNFDVNDQDYIPYAAKNLLRTMSLFCPNLVLENAKEFIANFQDSDNWVEKNACALATAAVCTSETTGEIDEFIHDFYPVLIEWAACDGDVLAANSLYALRLAFRYYPILDSDSLNMFLEQIVMPSTGRHPAVLRYAIDIIIWFLMRFKRSDKTNPAGPLIPIVNQIGNEILSRDDMLTERLHEEVYKLYEAIVEKIYIRVPEYVEAFQELLIGQEEYYQRSISDQDLDPMMRLDFQRSILKFFNKSFLYLSRNIESFANIISPVLIQSIESNIGTSAIVDDLFLETVSKCIECCGSDISENIETLVNICYNYITSESPECISQGAILLGKVFRSHPDYFEPDLFNQIMTALIDKCGDLEFFARWGFGVLQSMADILLAWTDKIPQRSKYTVERDVIYESKGTDPHPEEPEEPEISEEQMRHDVLNGIEITHEQITQLLGVFLNASNVPYSSETPEDIAHANSAFYAIFRGLRAICIIGCHDIEFVTKNRRNFFIPGKNYRDYPEKLNYVLFEFLKFMDAVIEFLPKNKVSMLANHAHNYHLIIFAGASDNPSVKLRAREVMLRLSKF